MDFLTLTNSLNMPGISAFMLGIMASIGPCTMATNIAALAYISRKLSDRKFAVTNAALYTVGRMITYTVLGMLIIYTGMSIPAVANFLQQFGEVAVGPFLIIVGIIMLFLDRIHFGEEDNRLAVAAKKFADMGLIGALPLGMVLALAFCPYSAVLFFMVLIPLALKTTGGAGLPAAFALGTGLPVLLFGTLLSLGVAGAARWINAIGNAEKYIRMAVAALFIVVGLVCIGLWLRLF
ncbi:MAG: aromatic aminobenezylarsenical efflux permease ArsG family transporter [Chloroflexi bacterium]|nr:aromatic aminobenezylarsenical efflux permease ArsG family transporter [Chloroflexota bacterium]